ncbi:MAG: hypothetical protein ACOH1Q_04625 [Thiobacillus sp.]
MDKKSSQLPVHCAPIYLPNASKWCMTAHPTRHGNPLSNRVITSDPVNLDAMCRVSTCWVIRKRANTLKNIYQFDLYKYLTGTKKFSVLLARFLITQC